MAPSAGTHGRPPWQRGCGRRRSGHPETGPAGESRPSDVERREQDLNHRHRANGAGAPIMRTSKAACLQLSRLYAAADVKQQAPIVGIHQITP